VVDHVILLASDDSGLLVFGVIVGIAAIALFAWIGSKIGESRGSKDSGALMGGLLGPIGLIAAAVNDKRPVCPHCSTRCQATANVCPACRHEIVAIKCADGGVRMVKPDEVDRELAAEIRKPDECRAAMRRAFAENKAKPFWRRNLSMSVDPRDYAPRQTVSHVTTAKRAEPAMPERADPALLECPFCFGEVNPKATVCRHCQREIAFVQMADGSVRMFKAEDALYAQTEQDKLREGSGPSPAILHVITKLESLRNDKLREGSGPSPEPPPPPSLHSPGVLRIPMPPPLPPRNN